MSIQFTADGREGDDSRIGSAGQANSGQANSGQPGLPFVFTGRGGEYFRIWIVNLALSILTLGIYSAWAKVRARRYFYANTLLDGAGFDYTAEPLKILKGRVIAALVIGAYVAAGQLYPVASLPLVFVYWLLFPWLLMKSLAFNAHYSIHRGLRFGFDQGVGDAVRVYALLPILIPLTLGIYYPFWKRRVAGYYVGNHRYGGTPFSFHATGGQYLRLYLTALPIILLCGALAGAVLAGLGWLMESLFASLQADAGDDGEPGARAVVLIQLMSFGMVALFYLCLLPVFAWLRARGDNLRWNNTRLGEHCFASDQSAVQLMLIYLLNVFAIVFTLGLAIPWAKVRLARYRAEHLRFVPGGPVDELLAGQDGETSATADAFDDLGGFDAGL